MAWIQTGNLKFYSISDTINSFTLQMFKLLTVLFQPWILMVLVLFFLSLCLYFYTAIQKRIINSGDPT